jgi:hypothetical protein
MIGHHLKKSNWVTQYEIYQDHDFIGGCFFDSGNGIFQLFLMLISALFAKQVYHRHSSRQGGLTLT